MTQLVKRSLIPLHTTRFEFYLATGLGQTKKAFCGTFVQIIAC